MSAQMSVNRGSLGFRVFRGIEAGLASQAVILAVNLLATPYLVRGLGTDGYGLFTLIFTLLNYLLLSTAGTVTGTQKYTAEHWRENAPPGLGRLLRAVLVFQIAAGFAACLVLVVGLDSVVRLFVNAGPEMRRTASWVFTCVAIVCPAYFTMFFATSILYGMQRFRTLYVYITAQSVAGAAAAAALLFFGGGLREIGVAFVAAIYVLAAGALFSARRPLLARRGGGKELELGGYFRFSLKSLLPQAMWVVTFQGDRIFIGSMLPLTQLGYYAIASSLAQKLNSVCESVAISAFPILTELHGRGEGDRLKRFYLKANELSLFLILPISVMTFILAPQFLTLWLGESFSRFGTWPVRFLVLGNMAYLACSLPNKVATGKGYPELFGYLQAAKSVVLIALWLWLIPRRGILGAALGFCIAEWLGSPLYVGYIHKRFLGLGWGGFAASACVRPGAAALALAALGLITHGRVGSWPAFIAYGSLGMAVYYGVGYRLLDPEAKKQLADWIRTKLSR